MSQPLIQKKKLAGIASFRMINALRNGIIYSFMGLYLRENLALSVTESNLLFTLIELIGAFAQLFVWGYIADKYRARTSLIIGAETIPAIGYIGLFYFHKYLLQTSGTRLAGLSIVFGFSALEFFWGAGFVGFYTLLADISDPNTRSKYMGYTLSGMSIGRICGSVIGGAFFDWDYSGGGFGEGILFFILSPLILGFAAVSFLTRKEIEISSSNLDRSLDLSSKDEVEKTSLDQELPLEEPAKIQRLFYWLLAGIIISSLGQGAVEQTTLYYLRLPESIEASAFLISLLSVVLWLGLSVSGPMAGRISEQNAPLWYFGTLTWFGILPILYSLIGTIPGSVILAILLFASRGIAMGLFSIASLSVLVKIIPLHKRGRLLSQYNAGLMLGWGVGGSVIGGPLADWRLNQGASLVSAYLTTFFAAFFIGILAISVTVGLARTALQGHKET